MSIGPRGGVAALALSVGLLAGCVSQPDVIVRGSGEGPRIVTMGLDARDYDELVTKLCASIAASARAPKGAVLALGPISLSDTVPDGLLDWVTLQEKLQVHVAREGTYKFSAVVKPTVARDDKQGNAMLAEIMKIRRLVYEGKQIDNAEDDIVWGGLAMIDVLVYGRMSRQQQSKGRVTEFTYRFNYKIGDCRTGEILWTDEVQWTKSR
jgi:hypothetical protein